MLIAQGYRIETGEMLLNIQDQVTGAVRQVTKDCAVLIVSLGPAGELPIAFPIEQAENMAEGFRVAATGIVKATAADIPIIGADGPAQAG